jgi:hypothetical protein
MYSLVEIRTFNTCHDSDGNTLVSIAVRFHPYGFSRNVARFNK